VLYYFSQSEHPYSSFSPSGFFNSAANASNRKLKSPSTTPGTRATFTTPKAA
jgi:hypothetical protein